MNELLTEILMIFYAALILAISTAATSLIGTVKENIKARTNDAKMKHYADEIASVVTEAVTSTNQTYVDHLKASGKFDEQAQIEAFNAAMETAVSLLSPAAKIFISELFGDVEDYLEPKIETAVRLQKHA